MGDRRRVGKTQAVLKHACVAADQLMAAGVANPVVVYVGFGRVADVRARLDKLGGGRVQVLEVNSS